MGTFSTFQILLWRSKSFFDTMTTTLFSDTYLRLFSDTYLRKLFVYICWCMEKSICQDPLISTTVRTPRCKHFRDLEYVLIREVPWFKGWNNVALKYPDKQDVLILGSPHLGVPYTSKMWTLLGSRKSALNVERCLDFRGEIISKKQSVIISPAFMKNTFRGSYLRQQIF